MLKFNRSIVAAVVIALVLTSCHRVQPVYEVVNSPISDSLKQKFSQAQVGDIITQAAISQGWRVEKIESGELRITQKWQDHSAVSRVLYSQKSYSIQLISSENLKQADGKIHRKYNEHVKALQNEIDRKLSLAAL